MANSSMLSINRIISARSDIQTIDPSEVPFLIQDTTIQQYFRIAILALIVFDSLITMDREAKYFWKMPRKPVEFVYFSNRYIGIIGACIYVVGNIAAWMRDIANWTTVILIDYILTIRVLALYSQDKKLATFLYTLLSLEAAFKFAIFIYGTILARVAVFGLARGATACGQDGNPPWQWELADWLCPLTYGTILMVLALYRGAGYWRMSAGFKGLTLVKVLIEDQLLYFLVVTLCSVFNIVQFRAEISNVFLSNFFTMLGDPTLLCILGSRMLFSLKEAGERGLNEGTSYRTTSRTASGIEFAQQQTGVCEEMELRKVGEEGNEVSRVV